VSDNDLEQKIHELLCIDATTGCQVSGQTAVPLAVELTHHHPQEYGAFELLGKAQYGVGQYYDAAGSFDKASTLASSQLPETIIKLQYEAGDAWYRSQDFEKAADRFKSALDGFKLIKSPLPSSLSDQQSAIRLQWARSLRYEGKREDAFSSLVDSAAVVNNPEPFNSELRELIASMQSSELIRAEPKNVPGQDAGLDSNVRVVLYDRIAEQYLVERSDIEKTNEYLVKAEAATTSETEPDVQAMTYLWRGKWYLVQGKWDSAKTALSNALALVDIPVIRYELSVCYYLWAGEEMVARAMSRDAEHPNAESPMSEQEMGHWQAAADTAKTILINSEVDPTNKIFSFAERIYRNSNHSIDKDLESKAYYQEMLKAHPDNLVVLKGYMGLCTDFLHDTCALDAAAKADTPGNASDLGLVLDIAEVDVQFGAYDKGIKKIQSLPLSLNDDALVYSAVARFYETWAYLAKGDPGRAAKSKAAWDADVALFWKQHTDKSDFNWIFLGAGKALDGEKKVPDQYISTLRGMIVAMGDPKAQRPTLPQ
jgi:tetratricopeptide (TPR) repeat protein